MALDFWDVKEIFDRAGVGNFGCYSNSFPGKNGVTITLYEVGIELREQIGTCKAGFR